MIYGAALIAAALFGHPVAGQDAPRLDEIHAGLARRGARATVQGLQAHGRFGFVLDKIGSGDPLWIALAPKLAPGADGADAEGLGIALAEALPQNPRTVLAVLDLRGGPVLAPSRVCSAPFIEPKPGVVKRYKATAIRAVAGVRHRSLARASAACLATLRAIPG